MTTGVSHWRSFHRGWSKLEAPLRPNAEIIEGVIARVGDRDRRVLLLGVTPELALAFENLVAVDKSAEMIANIWPGDGPARRVIAGDWLALDESLGTFSAAIGDGSVNAVAYPGELRRLFEVVRDCLEPGGRFVCRVYARPEEPWTWDALAAESQAPACVNFHAFKWKVAMRVAADTEPSVPVTRILDAFARHFPDRAVMAQCTGWDPSTIDMIDTYRGSTAVYCFPTRAEILASLPSGLSNAAFEPCGTYNLADHCPMFVCTRA
jgi:SAM-dependent methyltransferase